MFRIISVVASCGFVVTSGCFAAGNQSADDWLGQERVEVRTRLLDASVSAESGENWRDLAFPLLIITANRTGFVDLRSDVSTGNGQQIALSGQRLFESEAAGLPGHVYCGSVSPQSWRRGIPAATCLVDVDADGRFDLGLERAATVGFRSSLIYGGFAPTRLENSIPYDVSSSAELGQVRFELHGFDVSQSSSPDGAEIVLTMQYFEGDESRGDDGTELLLYHDAFGVGLDVWGQCIRFFAPTGNQIRFDYLGWASPTLTWPDRLAGSGNLLEFQCAPRSEGL